MRRLAALAVPYRLWRSVPEESPSCLKRRMKSIPLVVPLRTIFATNTQLVISRALLRLSLDTAPSTWTPAPAATADSQCVPAAATTPARSRRPAVGSRVGALANSPAASKQQSQRCSGQQCRERLLAVMDGDELRLSRADFKHANGNRAHAASTSAAFAFRLGIAHATGSGSCTEAVSDFCNGDDGSFAGCDRITEDAFHLRTSGKIFVQ